MKMTIQAHGKDVEVEDFYVDNVVPAFKVVANFGTTKVELTHTLASVDGGLAMPSSTHVQDALSRVRLRAAQTVVVREELRRQLRDAC